MTGRPRRPSNSRKAKRRKAGGPARRERAAATRRAPASRAAPRGAKRPAAAPAATARPTSTEPETLTTADPLEIDRIGDAVVAALDAERALELLLTEARRLTHAEAGTVYVREGGHLRFAVVQNDVLAQRLGTAEVKRLFTARPLGLTEPSIATYVALTRATVNLRDAYAIPMDRPYALYQQIDKQIAYRTRSVLATPLRDTRGAVFGVLQLINAVSAGGEIVPFDKGAQALVIALAARAAPLAAALAIRA
jgi:hypothetical protein